MITRPGRAATLMTALKGVKSYRSKPGWSSSKRPRRLVILLSRRLSGLVIVLKPEASILPKLGHESRERCLAVEDYWYARVDCAAKYCARGDCAAKTTQEGLRDGKLWERSQFGRSRTAAGFLQREGTSPPFPTTLITRTIILVSHATDSFSLA